MAEKKTKLVENKIKPTGGSVVDYLNTITPEQKRKDSFTLLEMMQKASKEEPTLWSNSLIGFGFKTHISPTTGRQSQWMRIGFSVRKANFSLYFGGLLDTHATAMEKLGKYKTGLGCLYVNKLSDIDLKILETMIEEGCKLA